VRQVDLQKNSHAWLLLMHRVDEAAPAAQIVQLDWRFERPDPDAVKRAVHASVHASAVSGLGVHGGDGRNPLGRQRPLNRTRP
jgi:hypothetical protein